MTDDILAQLALVPAWQDDLHAAAAAEITRLRADLDAKSAAYRGLTAHVEKLQAELDAARADAARYRWLKPRVLGADFAWGDRGDSVLVFELPRDARVWPDLDGMIDAAAAPTEG